MLSDLTLDIWVPNFLCREAHRTQRNTPRLQLAHPSSCISAPYYQDTRSWYQRTWVASSAVCAAVIPLNLEKILQGSLVPRLLALVYYGGHAQMSREAASLAYFDQVCQGDAGRDGMRGRNAGMVSLCIHISPPRHPTFQERSKRKPKWRVSKIVPMGHEATGEWQVLYPIGSDARTSFNPAGGNDFQDGRTLTLPIPIYSFDLSFERTFFSHIS